MANTIKERPLDPLMSELQQKGFSPAFQIAFRDLLTRSDKTQNNNGEILAKANVSGRTEQIGTTLQNVDTAGTILSAGVDFSRAYPNKNTDNIADGTGSPLSGGKRGFVALDTNNRLAGSFRNNALNVTSFFTSTNPLSQSGTSTLILVAASTRKFGDGNVSYNSGSVDPGVLGGWTVYADDPTFAGGAMSYQATQANNNLSANNGRLNFGSITTVGGGGGSGVGGGDGEFPPRLL